MSESTTLDELRTALGKAEAALAVVAERERLSREALTETRKAAAVASDQHKTDKKALDEARAAVAAHVRQVVAAERAT